MAVPEGKRSESKFEVLTQAEKLASYTIEMCNKEKAFPKRSRWTLANRIVNTALDILDNIRFANSVYVSLPCDFVLRRNAQTTALGKVETLLGLVDLDNYFMKLWGGIQCLSS
mgnify:CR=1 FL=1